MWQKNFGLVSGCHIFVAPRKSTEKKSFFPSVTTPSAGLQTTFGAGKAKALYISYYLIQPNQAKLHNKVHMGRFWQKIAKNCQLAQTPALPHYCAQWDSVV